MAQDEPAKPADPPSKLEVGWRGVGVGAVVVWVAALATLVIVADNAGAEGLATVALSLAILAFVVQVLVFITQGATANRQKEKIVDRPARQGVALGGQAVALGRPRLGPAPAVPPQLTASDREHL